MRPTQRGKRPFQRLRKDGDRVKLYSRPGNDLTARIPLIVEALVRLRSRSCSLGSNRTQRAVAPRCASFIS